MRTWIYCYRMVEAPRTVWRRRAQAHPRGKLPSAARSLGWLLDRTVLRRVAQGTADQLLSALSRELARAVAHAAPLVGANGR